MNCNANAPRNPLNRNWHRRIAISTPVACPASPDFEPERTAILNVAIIVFDQYLLVGCNGFHRDDRYRAVSLTLSIGRIGIIGMVVERAKSQGDGSPLVLSAPTEIIIVKIRVVELGRIVR